MDLHTGYCIPYVRVRVIQVTRPVKLVWMFRLGGFVIASTLRVQPWVAIELCIGAQCGKRRLRRSRCRVGGRCQVVSAAVRSRIRAAEQVDLPQRSVRSG